MLCQVYSVLRIFCTRACCHRVPPVLSSWNIGRSHVGTENLLLVSLLRARHPEQGLVDRGLCAEQPMTHDAQHEGRRRTRPDRPSRRTRNGHSEQHREPYVHDGNVCDPKRVHALPGNPENVLVWTAAAHFPRPYILSFSLAGPVAGAGSERPVVASCARLRRRGRDGTARGERHRGRVRVS